MIESIRNPRIKHLMLLSQKSQQRRAEGLFVVEGRREVEHCLEAGFAIRTAFVCEEIAGAGLRMPQGVEVLPVTPGVYERIAYRGGTEGIVAVAEARRLGLVDLHLSPSPLLVVLEGVEKPGNLGAVMRTADAAGADAVIVCDPLTDLYNPNLIRAAMGAAFTVPAVACSSEDCIAFLRRKGVSILTAQLQDSCLYYDTPMTGSTAIVMGTEHAGLTTRWRQAADRHIRIPMLGQLDSLNVSVSAAILLFEAVRQRQTT